MKKIDLHMHVMTMLNIPKIGKLNLSNPAKMIAHMDELGISKAVLMSSGEKKSPFGKNKTNLKICQKYPEHFAWMCTVDPVDAGSVYDRLALYKQQGAIGVGEFTINRKLDDSFLQAVFAAAENMVFPLGAWLDEQVEKGRLSRETYEKICWGNAQRVFGL